MSSRQHHVRLDGLYRRCACGALGKRDHYRPTCSKCRAPPAFQGHANLTAVSARYLAAVEATTADQLRRMAAASALDVPALVSEVDRLTWMLVRTRLRYANLAAAARAAFAADADGDPDPWAYLRDELDHPSPQDLWLPRGLGDHTRNELSRDEGSG